MTCTKVGFSFSLDSFYLLYLSQSFSWLCAFWFCSENITTTRTVLSLPTHKDLTYGTSFLAFYIPVCNAIRFSYLVPSTNSIASHSMFLAYWFKNLVRDMISCNACIQSIFLTSMLPQNNLHEGFSGIFYAVLFFGVLAESLKNIFNLALCRKVTVKSIVVAF